MAGNLRAGVTDGRRVWFVREGDPLPGDVRVGRIAARPPGVQIEGADDSALPYRAQARRRLMTRQPASTRPDTTAKTMVQDRSRGFLPGPGRRNGNAAAETPDTKRLIRVPAMDVRFRRICAVFAGGRCLIARGYEADARLRSALLALRQSGAIPVAVAEETATLEEIAECLAGGGRRIVAGRGRSGGPAGQTPVRGRSRGPGERRGVRDQRRRLSMSSPSSTTASCPWPNR